MVISLQRVTLEDATTLLEIEKTTAGLKTYSGYFTEEEIKNYINNDIVYFIKKNDEIVGSISYEINDEEHAYESGLVIKPEFQGRGLAKQALAKLLEELSKFKVVDLAVHPDNISALKLYESFGFVIKERKENFFGDGEPRLIMVLEK
ncbi:MAG: GNAT family N-acetyltransferase [Candidatus Buchananbacteria bacterium]